jgi:hypothetical protein
METTVLFTPVTPLFQCAAAARPSSSALSLSAM